MAKEFLVPVSSDGREFEVPVEADTEDEAREAVRSALASGELDLPRMEVQQPTPTPTPGSLSPTPESSPTEFVGGLAAKQGSGVLRGIQDSAFNVGEFGLLLTESLASALGNQEVANTRRAERNQLRQFRKDLEAKEDTMLQSAFGSDYQASAAEKFVGEALFFSPLAPVGTGKTFARALTSNVSLGVVEGGAMQAPDAETLADTAGGMTIGGIIGTAASAGQVRSGARAFMGRKLRDELDDPLAQQGLALEKEIQRRTGNPNFSFSVSQLSAQNPWLIGLERGAIGRASLEKQNANVQSLVELIMRRGQQLDPEQFVMDLNQSVVRAVNEIHDIASSNYGRHVDAILEAYGDDIVLDGQKYQEDLLAFIGELGDPRKIGASAHRELVKHAEFVKTRLAKEGGLTSEDVVEILKGHNELISGKRAITELATAGSAEHIGKYLKASMLESMEGTTSGAVQSIRDATNAYAFDMQKARVIENSFLGKIFNGTPDQVAALMQSPDEALNRLSSLSPSAMANAKKILAKVAPELLDDMKRTVISRAVEGAVDTSTSAGMNIVDPRALSKALAGTKGSGLDRKVGGLGLGLLDAAEQREIVSAAEALRRIQTTVVKDIGKDTVGIASDATINVISRSKEFFARWIVRFAGKSKDVEALLINPSSRKALLELADKGPGSVNGRLAIAWLTAYVGDLAAERDRKANEQERQDILSNQSIRPEGF